MNTLERITFAAIGAAGITAAFIGLASVAYNLYGVDYFPAFSGRVNGETVKLAAMMPWWNSDWSKLKVKKGGVTTTYLLREVGGPKGRVFELEVAVREANGVTTEYDLNQLFTPGGEYSDVVKELKAEAAGYLERIAQANREGR